MSHVGYLALVPTSCGLSRIGYAYLTWVAMRDRFFRQRDYIGITQSCMHWYVKKNCLTWVKTTEITIWCARNMSDTCNAYSFRGVTQCFLWSS